MVSVVVSGVGGFALGALLLGVFLCVLYALVRLAVRHELRGDARNGRLRSEVSSGVGRVRDLHRRATAAEKYPQA
jgi:hypothetical protein